jgi:hypothetical protein
MTRERKADRFRIGWASRRLYLEQICRLWQVEPFDPRGGFDGFTAGIKVGPIIVDGSNYGQEWGAAVSDSLKEQMTLDAHLIAGAPDMVLALAAVLAELDERRIPLSSMTQSLAISAFKKAVGVI